MTTVGPSDAMIEAAAKAIYEGWFAPGVPEGDAGWSRLESDDYDRDSAVTNARHALAAVLPLIREQIAEEIESHGARRKSDNRLRGLIPIEQAARIARGGVS